MTREKIPTTGKYVLVDRQVVEVFDLLEWAEWIETSQDRRVAYDDMNPGYVSTVFLGLDHSFGSGPPLFFETFIKDTGTDFDGEIFRHSTFDEALERHKELMVKINNLRK